MSCKEWPQCHRVYRMAGPGRRNPGPVVALVGPVPVEGYGGLSLVRVVAGIPWWGGVPLGGK
ncbi:hypothetical protein ACFFX0_31715 [Citricoccus parietis]|uniref:Uncharacterized protein n=1 Tax=Citricoccus parietis TaxID=592307 RepID=A0ABV5GA50_9MICC